MANANNAIAEAVNTGSNVAGEALDDYGRTEQERTVVLASADAEAVNREVEAGEHDSYDDALAHIIERGLAEIKRTRASSLKLADAKRIAANAKTWAALLKLNPSLLADPKVMARYAEELTPRY